MPTFQIGLEDGRSLKIDADDHDAAIAGAQHFLQNNPMNNSVAGGLVQGASDTARSVGQSLDQLGLPGGQAAEGLADKVAPANYQPAQVVQNGAINSGDIPRAMAQQAAPIAAPILAGRLASRFFGPEAGALVGLGTAGLEYFGPNVLARAKAEGHDTPTTGDKVNAGLTTAAQMAANSIAMKRFMPGANPVTATGLAGATQAVKKLATTAGAEGLAGGAQSVIGDVGAGLGTPQGVSVDPNQAASSAITGALTGGAFAGPRALADVNNASAFRHFDPDLQSAAQAFSQRAVDAAGGRNLASTAVGGDAFNKARAGVQSELGDSIKAAGPLGPDADNVLASIKSGGIPTSQDYGTLQTALQGNPDAEPLMYLARQAHAASLLAEMGSNHDGNFTGGLASKTADLAGLNSHGTAKAAVAAILAEHLGSHLIAMSPYALGGALGVYGLARLADRMSGSRSPMNRFVQQFQPNGTPRIAPTAPPPGPTSGPTGPSVPLNAGITGGPLAAAVGASPWALQAPAAPPVNEAANLRSQVKDATDLMNARRANNAQTVAQTMPVLAQLAAHLKAQQDAATAARAQDAQYAAADQANQAFDQRTQRSQMTDASALMAARRANNAQTAAQAAPLLARLAAANKPQPTPAPINPLALPSSITGPARSLMTGAMAAQKMRDAQPTVQMRDASQLMAARRANAKLQEGDEASPEGGSLEAVSSPAEAPVLKVTKANGKVTSEGSYVQETNAALAAESRARMAKDSATFQERLKDLSNFTPPAGMIPEQSPVEQATKAQAPAFQPLPDNEKPYEGMDHGEVAEAKMQGKYANVSKERRESVRSGIINGRQRDENALKPIMDQAGTNLAVTAPLYDLLQELHHTSSRSRAKAARDYYASQLPSDVAEKVRKALPDGFINRSKHRD